MTYRSILVTGTDTGVGKTVVTCCLASALRARGHRVGVFKPVETGCRPGSDGILQPEDAALLKWHAHSPLHLEAICPYAFPEPLAPMLAAQRTGRVIDVAGLATGLHRIEADNDVTLVEGAGGLLVPITKSVTYADLAARFTLAVLVVVGSKLGAINHALLTVHYLQQRALPFAGYVINFPVAGDDLAARTNVEVLTELLGRPLGILPHLGVLDTTDEGRRRLAAAAERHIQVDRLLAAG